MNAKIHGATMFHSFLVKKLHCLKALENEKFTSLKMVGLMF